MGGAHGKCLCLVGVASIVGLGRLDFESLVGSHAGSKGSLDSFLSVFAAIAVVIVG